MKTPGEKSVGARGFRTRLLVAMMLVVCGVIALALYFTERNVAANVERDLRRQFDAEVAALHGVQELRQTALLERCRSLVRKPRIHAALEDNALDLLYPSAKDELRDVMEAPDNNDQPGFALHAEFYRFLGPGGTVIMPPNFRDVGVLHRDEAAKLALPELPRKQQLGYLTRQVDGLPAVFEIIAMPIISTETGEAIAALVLGFKPAAFPGSQDGSQVSRGIWYEGRLYLPSLPAHEVAAVTNEVREAIAHPKPDGNRIGGEVGGVPHLLFYQKLNDGSAYPPAYEVCIYPLTELVARQKQLRWELVGAGALLLLLGLGVSHVLASRLSVPVEQLAVDSAANLAQRQRAEAALETTSEELQRAARFSADASHQLKTPVTVMRAGLEELLASESLGPDDSREVSALIHQTYRLSGVIEDLLLLSRMDAGRLKLDFSAVNLTQLIEASIDDLEALPNGPDFSLETDFPSVLHVAGEKRYTSLILQNLLENARKYNRPGGRIRIIAREEGDVVHLTLGNTGRPIPSAAQEHIFQRFHRGAMGENVPGYGLGLNLARELARLHGGDLRLVRSDEEWTEFEVTFRTASRPAPVVSA